MIALSGFGIRVMLGICPEKTIIQKDTGSPMLTAVLLTWKQPICPSTKERINKMWYMYTKESYSAIKMDKIWSFVETWLDLDVDAPYRVK